MEAHLVTSFATDEPLAAHFGEREPEDWIYATSSLGMGENEASPEPPFLIWNELTSSAYREVAELSNAELRNFQIFVHDYKGDYTRIGLILRDVRRIVKAMAPFQVTLDGVTYRCSQSDWMGISGSLVDPQYDTSVKYGLARFTVSS